MKTITALMVAATVGLFATAHVANAFNPQPEPPGKARSNKAQNTNPATDNTNTQKQNTQKPGSADKLKQPNPAGQSIKGN